VKDVAGYSGKAHTMRMCLHCTRGISRVEIYDPMFCNSCN